MAGDAFHPDLAVAAPAPARVHHVRAADLDAGTAQTSGMRRFAAISGRKVGCPTSGTDTAPVRISPRANISATL